MRLFAVFSLLLAGCLPPNSVTTENAESSLGPIERLGRFDGDEFREVEPGSIPPSRLHVIVHGWAPGWAGLTQADPRARSWEAAQNGRPFEPWVRSLAEAILRADPHAVVLAYSWLDDAATARGLGAQRRALAHTDLHGRWLAQALGEAMHEDARVHLLGHSYGARVVTLAALYLPRKPERLTLFDAPDAPMTYLTGSQTALARLLRMLPIGSAPGEVFVDNYVSIFGTPYHGGPGLTSIVDVILAPPYAPLNYRRRHLYPMDYYARTADLEFGLGWCRRSPAHGPAPGCYQQAYDGLALTRGCAGMP